MSVDPKHLAAFAQTAKQRALRADYSFALQGTPLLFRLEAESNRVCGNVFHSLLNLFGLSIEMKKYGVETSNNPHKINPHNIFK